MQCEKAKSPLQTIYGNCDIDLFRKRLLNTIINQHVGGDIPSKDFIGFIEAALIEGSYHLLYDLYINKICTISKEEDDILCGFGENQISLNNLVEREKAPIFRWIYLEFDTISLYFSSIDYAVDTATFYSTACGRAIQKPNLAILIEDVDSRVEYLMAASNYLILGDLIVQYENETNNYFTSLFPSTQIYYYQ